MRRRAGERWRERGRLTEAVLASGCVFFWVECRDDIMSSSCDPMQSSQERIDGERERGREGERERVREREGG